MLNTPAALHIAALWLLLAAGPLRADLKPEDVPTFRLRARVTSVGGEKPALQKFSFRFGVGNKSASTVGEAWSEWLQFGGEEIAATLKGYPAIYLKGWPVVVRLDVGGVVDPTAVEAELEFSGTEQPAQKLTGELFGPRLGILIWRDGAGTPHAATMADTKSLPDVAKGSGTRGEFTAVGVRGRLNLTDAPEGVEARFEDGSPAVVQRTIGQGQIVHFAWLPGLSYWKSSQGTQDGLPVGFSETIRGWITWPVELAQIEPPVVVNRPLVETPVLVCEAGAAMTLLNWTGKPIESLEVAVRVPFPVRSIESVRHGDLDFHQEHGRIELTVPLDVADIILLRRAN